MTNPFRLRDHQKEAIEKLRTGSILMGGVGSGKTIASLAYFYLKECGGTLDGSKPPPNPKDLYVITTARKRDSLDWEREATLFTINKDPKLSAGGIKLVVDSWNNIKKYVGIKDAFFIFDEQRVVGSGAWAKAFIKISKNNKWILLSATPGDTWMDYIPVFIANGFYKNRTAFIREHVVFNSFVNFPKVDRYLGTSKLRRLRDRVLVKMPFERHTVPHNIDVIVPYDEEKMLRVTRDKWNVFKDEPIVNSGEGGYVMRRVVNSSPDRIKAVKRLAKKHKKIIVFYNFNYELDVLRQIDLEGFDIAEYNGHLHQDIPKSEKWLYLVQYVSGAEAWNCTETNVIVYYSLNYSYRLTTQAAGRINRLTTPFVNLYYYFIRSESSIDRGIMEALKNKTDFNERRFLRDNKVYF